MAEIITNPQKREVVLEDEHRIMISLCSTI
jgi:hypothetical protein